ncbi:TniQ family protein [Endozoicomonas ascidiicola]|uniref:TniQ family protein n=1 Tax=Endozoicomonas ascidiicola TaxID=1698521 RepID=UPI00082E761C|nr:TniQ family protein [Endozoicomonas ascidiicola]USN27018.1 TniQ family protein [synthetic construct]
MLLLSRPTPNKLESLRGYILRLSQANSYHTTQYVLELADLWTGRNYDTASKYVFGDSNLSKLAKITNTSKGELEALRYGLDDQKQSSIHGHLISNEHLRLDYPRVCPECLESNNIALAVWDIPALTVCPVHHMSLFDYCPECNTRLRWNRPAVHQCHKCNCDFRSYTSDKLSEKQYRLSRLIHQLCMIDKINHRMIPNVLKNHSLAEVLSLVSSIAFFDYHLLGDQSKDGKFLSLKTAPNYRLHEHYTNAMKHLDNWPHNFYQFMAESRQNRRSQGMKEGISKEVGGIFYFLRANNEKAIYRPLWEAYCNFREVAARKTLDELRLARIHAKNIPVSTAAKELKIRPEQLRKFCERLNIPLETAYKDVKLISREQVADLKDFISKLLTIRQSADIMGISVYQLRAMVRKDVITPLRGPTIDQSRDWYFEPESIEAFHQQIAKYCLYKGAKRTHDMDLKQALEQLSYYQMGLAEIVQAISAGKLRPASESKAITLNALQFSAEEIKALRPELKSNNDYWQPPEIEKYLGCKKDLVYGLLKSGHLPMEKVSLPGRTRPVVACKKSEVKAFNENFYLLRTLSRKTGVVSEKLRKLLEAKKIQPVSGPTVDGGYCHFYKKNKNIDKLLKELGAK